MSPGSHSANWPVEIGAVAWATYIAVSQSCQPGVKKDVDVVASFARRGLNFNDYRPGGKYETIVAEKTYNTKTWFEGMGVAEGCKGMREFLESVWPESLSSAR